jgi:hypothetical protein
MTERESLIDQIEALIDANCYVGAGPVPGGEPDIHGIGAAAKAIAALLPPVAPAGDRAPDAGAEAVDEDDLVAALEGANWSGVSIGNKLLIRAAINALKATDAHPPAPASDARVRVALECCHRVLSFDLKRMIDPGSSYYNQAVRDAYNKVRAALAQGGA